MKNALGWVLFWLVFGFIVLVAVRSHAGMVDQITQAEAIFQTPAHIGFVQHGRASWYAPTGRRTASGAKYSGVDCAHRSLPFGTRVRVTRIDNGRSIRCYIKDRGPFVKGRIIDLQRRIAVGLGMTKAGHVAVKVEEIK